MIGSCVPRLLGGLMARMHTHRKGSSGSTKPFVTEAPEWSLTDKNEIERLILSLHEKGNNAAAIGRILRDQHAVPSVRLIMGERIAAILARNEVTMEFPDDLRNLMARAVRLQDHLSANHRDLHNRRQLELTEAKIRRLVRYLKSQGRLDGEFRYRRDTVRLMLA